MKLLAFCILLWASVHPGRAEAAADRTISVLPTTDTSGAQMGPIVQRGLATKLREIQRYQVQESGYILPGFSGPMIEEAFGNLGTELFCFAYLEPERLSLILFDSQMKDQYLVTSQPLVDPTQGAGNANQIVEYNLNVAFQNFVMQIDKGDFYQLPGQRAQLSEKEEADRQISSQAKALYEELTLIHDRPIYFGANLGMVRVGHESASASTIDLGVYLGMQVARDFQTELGLDIFSQLMTSGSFRYRLPIGTEQFLSVYATANIGLTMGKFTENLGSDETAIPRGTLLFGPGIAFEVPMFGAKVRGGIKVYFGDGSILLGNYGITYAFNV